MEYILIFALWSDGSEEVMKLHSEKFSSDRATCERMGREMERTITKPENGFRATATCKRVGR